MSVGIVYITQRKCYKDALRLLHRELLKPLCQRALYLSSPLTKEKWLFGKKLNKCDEYEEALTLAAAQRSQLYLEETGGSEKS